MYIYILPINTVVTRFQNSRRKRSEPRLIADRIIRNRISGGKREQLAKLPRSESNTRTTESRGFTLARFCSVESGTLIERAHRWKIVFTEHTEESWIRCACETWCSRDHYGGFNRWKNRFARWSEFYFQPLRRERICWFCCFFFLFVSLWSKFKGKFVKLWMDWNLYLQR